MDRTLPLEILEQIADHLFDTDRPGIWAFALTSNTCRRATLQCIFQEAYRNVQARKTLQGDIDALRSVLFGADNCARHTHRLVIKGELILDEPRNRPESSDARDRNTTLEGFRQTGIAEVLGDQGPYLDGPIPPDLAYPDEAIKVSREEDLA